MPFHLRTTRRIRLTDLLFSQPLRLSLSLCACFAAVALCVHLHHVQVTLADPSTYHSFSEHRCGRLFLLTFTWALIETSLTTTRRLIAG